MVFSRTAPSCAEYRRIAWVVHGEAGAAVVHGEAGATVVHGEVGAGVVVRHAQQTSFVHPVAVQTGSPGTLVQGAGGQVKEEQVKCVVVVQGVVVRHTQQSSFVHPVAAQTGSPGTLVQGAGGHVKEEQVKCVVVVQGVVVGCKQQSSADGVPWRLYACGHSTHPAGHWKVVQVGGATVVQGAAGATVAQGLEQETERTRQAKRSARTNMISAHTVPSLMIKDPTYQEVQM